MRRMSARQTLIEVSASDGSMHIHSVGELSGAYGAPLCGDS